jgi:hypothetical protein
VGKTLLFNEGIVHLWWNTCYTSLLSKVDPISTILIGQSWHLLKAFLCLSYNAIMIGHSGVICAWCCIWLVVFKFDHLNASLHSLVDGSRMNIRCCQKGGVNSRHTYTIPAHAYYTFKFDFTLLFPRHPLTSFNQSHGDTWYLWAMILHLEWLHIGHMKYMIHKNWKTNYYKCAIDFRPIV